MGIIAAVTALVWAVLLLRMGQIDRWFSREFLLCGLAFIGGALSTIPTLFLVIIEDAYVGYQPDGNLVPTIAFYVGGVGLREEFCKLLFFLPFAPYLAKKRFDLDALIVASFVGLGFAAAFASSQDFGSSRSNISGCLTNLVGHFTQTRHHIVQIVSQNG